MNRAQQVFRTENPTFASVATILDTKVADGKYFTFTSTQASEVATSTASAINSAGDNTSNQTGTVTYTPSSGVFTVTTSWQ